MTESDVNIDAAWDAVSTEAQRLLSSHGRDLLTDEQRFSSSSIEACCLLVDWSRQRIDSRAIAALHHLSEQLDLTGFLQQIAAGAKLNLTENRAVQHVALRDAGTHATTPVHSKIRIERERMLAFADDVRNGNFRGCDGDRISDVVHIGIGGSHLGPALVCSALRTSEPPTIHFVSGIDPNSLQDLLASLIPGRTLFVVASKTYTTHETLENARLCRAWLTERAPTNSEIDKHFVHVTSRPDSVPNGERTFTLPDSVGGRFSLWSTMGLPVALSLGRESFDELLRGAHEMDEHALNAPTHENVAVILSLLAVWNCNFLNAGSHLILPYEPRLALLPVYLQQLEMESNGKGIAVDGSRVRRNTVPAVWGGPETDGQHAWHQWLHQGTHSYSADFIATLSAPADHEEENVHRWTLANALSQSLIMLAGKHAKEDAPFTEIPGNHGSTLILLKELNPRTLGALIALYEQKVACLGRLWNINSFDQWGVEEGKNLANRIHNVLNGASDDDLDPVTRELVRTMKNRLADA